MHRSMCVIVVWALKKAGSLYHAGMHTGTIALAEPFIVCCPTIAPNITAPKMAAENINNQTAGLSTSVYVHNMMNI